MIEYSQLKELLIVIAVPFSFFLIFIWDALKGINSQLSDINETLKRKDQEKKEGNGIESITTNPENIRPPSLPR